MVKWKQLTRLHVAWHIIGITRISTQSWTENPTKDKRRGEKACLVSCRIFFTPWLTQMPFRRQVMGKLNSKLNLSRAHSDVFIFLGKSKILKSISINDESLQRSDAFDKSVEALIVGKSIQQLKAPAASFVPAISIDSNYFNETSSFEIPQFQVCLFNMNKSCGKCF